MGKRKNRGQKKKKSSGGGGGGSMMGMRSGFKGAVGQKSKRKKRKQSSLSMVQVLAGGFALAALLVVIWKLTS